MPGKDFLYICPMSPYISIIIPFYGTADKALLQRCLDSIHRQGMEEGSYEVIVADDVNQTTGGARNNGIRQAQGEYMLFVDADDVLLPHALCPCLSLLRQYSPDILKFGFQEFSRNSSLEKRRLPNQPLPYVEYVSGAGFMALNNFTGVVWTHFFRKSLLETSSLCFSETSFFEDEEFVAKAYFYARKMLVTPYKVYGYFCLPTSLTRVPAEEECRKRVAAFKDMLFRLQEFYSISQCSVQPAKALSRRIRFLVIDYIRQMWRNKCSIKEINQELAVLKQEGLLPLPNENYGWKYRLVFPVVNVYTHLFI